jgi:hypothetical protein
MTFKIITISIAFGMFIASAIEILQFQNVSKSLPAQML